MSTDLDTFETALLARLHDLVDERNATGVDSLASLRDRRTTIRRRLLVGAGVAAAAVAGVVLVPGLGPEPAYSVGEGNAGQIHVKVNRLEDGSGLEQALAEHGIPADVTFLPDAMTCADGRYTPVTERRGMLLSVGVDSFEVTLAPGAVKDGETFVLAASVVPMPEIDGFRASVLAEVATGDVAPCDPVPASRP